MKIKYLILLVAAVCACVSCGDEFEDVNKEQSTENEEPENNGGSDAPEVFEAPVDSLFISEYEEATYLSLEEIQAMGILAIDRDDESFYDKILPERRTHISMRPGDGDTLTVDLLSPANIRFQFECVNLPSVIVHMPQWIRCDCGWAYGPCTVDYGPITATSLSPTKIQIRRNGITSPDQKPIEIVLERQQIDWVPYEPGVYCTLVVELSDTPADTRDDEYISYISQEEADSRGIFYMDFDDPAFLDPIVENNRINIDMFNIGDEATITLLSPAEIAKEMPQSPEYTSNEGKRVRHDEARLWMFNPSRFSVDGIEYEMTDPYHIKMKRVGDCRTLGSSVWLRRGDYLIAPDAGEASALICVYMVRK